MQLPGTATVANVTVTVSPTIAIRGLYQEARQSLNLPLDAILRRGNWITTESLRSSGHSREVETIIRPATEDEVKLWEAFDLIFNTMLKWERAKPT